MSISELNIRDARLNDLDLIYAIELETFPDAYPKGLLKAFFFMPGCVLVAEAEGTIIGYAIGIFKEDGTGHIVSIAVKKKARRKGAGSALLGTILRRFWSKSMWRAVLEVRKSNLEAKSLYEKFGFKKKGEVERYYQDGECAEVMELLLRDRQRP
ncbi:MAG: ribosomal protein S18-alanine N-acetyltransferase [Candidatus Verstraetearchaeota archaeon]|nr:ribosomal protein S18-alanine N-acetyltransferase [Candidatus Verstraetearchaeota archaeon]